MFFTHTKVAGNGVWQWLYSACVECVVIKDYNYVCYVCSKMCHRMHVL